MESIKVVSFKLSSLVNVFVICSTPLPLRWISYRCGVLRRRRPLDLLVFTHHIVSDSRLTWVTFHLVSPRRPSSTLVIPSLIGRPGSAYLDLGSSFSWVVTPMVDILIPFSSPFSPWIFPSIFSPRFFVFLLILRPIHRMWTLES